MSSKADSVRQKTGTPKIANKRNSVILSDMADREDLYSTSLLLLVVKAVVASRQVPPHTVHK